MELRHDQFEKGTAPDAPQGSASSPDTAFPLVLAAAFAGAMVSWFIPVGLYETIVESLGLSELIGSFAAPLGLKARLLISLAFAIGCALLVALMLGVLTPKRTRSRADAAPRSPNSPSKGPKTMANQGSESQLSSEPARPKSFIDGIRAGLSRLPAPRRFQDGDAKASGDSFTEPKRLRSGAAMTQRSDISAPPPIAAHAELGAPLPPLTPDARSTAPFAGQPVKAPAPEPERPASYHRQESPSAVMPPAAGATVPDQAHAQGIRSNDIDGFDQNDLNLSTASAPAKTQSDGSIEDLASRLARALGRGSDGLPDRDEEDKRASAQPSTAEPVAVPVPNQTRLKEQRDAEAACDAARLALEEAEEALDRAKSHVEEAREAARLAVEEAEHSVERASERAGQARQRLASTEAEAARVKQALEADARAAEQAERSTASVTGSVAEESETQGREEERDDMMDPALRDALRTLRRMTA